MTVFASHLLGTVINGLRPVSNTNQPIELQPGQIFRGVIQRAFPNNMVQVQIAGTTIMAELNASLEVGQHAWLQVQPQSHPIMLKVLDSPRPYGGQTQEAMEATERATMEGLLRALGMKADRTNVQNLQRLIELDIPLKSEDIERSLELLRATSSPASTIQALQIASARGLPLQNEVVRSLEAVLFGRSMNEIIETINQHQPQHRQSAEFFARINTIWEQARLLLPPSSAFRNAVQEPVTARIAMPPPPSPVWSPAPTSSSSNALPASNMELAGAPSTPQGATALPERSQLQAHPATSFVAPPPLQTDVAQTQGRVTTQESGLLQFFKLLGVDYEQSVATRMGQPPDAQASVKQEVLHQLKGIFLELRSLETTASPLREALDQGIRMITGQQLLMVNDPATPWNSFVFQIPLHSKHDSERSYVQIEGRKKGRDAIDAENCRLFFHLDLEALQTTMIDIHIIDRMMSIHVYNDHEWLKDWIDDSREQWKIAMQEQNYQLATIKVTSLPKAENKKIPSNALSVQGSRYQGVDVRI